VTQASSSPATAPAPPASDEVVIDVRDVVKDYGNLRALDHVTFQIRRGEMVGFLGVNGAGKSTTMKIITSYIPATSGAAAVCGSDVFYDSRAARRRIGYMPEIAPLYRDMRIAEYLAYRAKLKDVPWRARLARVGDCMKRAEVDDRAGQIIGTLSRGYRQRVGLADALIGDPEILILDEPTAGLDPRQKVAFRQLISDMAGEKTVFLSTHLLFELEDLKSRIVMIHSGRIIPDEKIRRLIEENAVFVTVRGDIVKARGILQGIGGVTPALQPELSGAPAEPDVERFRVVVPCLRAAGGVDVRERISTALTAAGLTLIELAVRRPSLEEVFVRLTQREDEEGAR
jgi:ABC-2 type transport system ATP-binding protein